jgi:threonine synthase
MFLAEVQCKKCGKKYATEAYATTCPNCNGILTAIYALEDIREQVSPSVLERRIPSVWKYFEFLPVLNKSNIVSLGEGGTFLHKCERLAEKLGLQNLYLKDETTNPTGAFIDRGTTVEVSKIKEFGFKSVCCGLSGNLAASLVAYAARAGLRCKIFLPQRVDVGKFYQTIAYGADIEIARDKEDACRNAWRWVVQGGNTSHFVMPYNLYFLEGEKTTAYEICEQFNWTPPDAIIVPTGSGGHLSMIWKGINELYQIGFLNEKTVKLIGVQAEGCAPIVETYKKGSNKIIPTNKVSTIAIDIGVREPPCGEMALAAIRESKGTAVSVSDKEIIDAVSVLAKLEGIFAEPASATTIAGLKKLVDEGAISPSEKVVCVITGMGLKYPEVTKTLVKGNGKLEKLLRRVERRKYTTRLGETKLHILQIISRKESYGYEIWKILGERFKVKLKIPSVYQHLAELEDGGLIMRSKSETFGKVKRNYYKLTDRGRSVLIQLKNIAT